MIGEMGDYDRIVRLLLLTGCRRGEVGGMRWEEFGSGSIGDVWLVPAERMKGGKPHLVPLTELAVAQLPERKGSKGD